MDIFVGVIIAILSLNVHAVWSISSASSFGNKESMPYQFAYGVNSPETGDVKEHLESTSESGRTEGEYRWLQPNGFFKVVRYYVEGPSGFQAEVTEEKARPSSIKNYFITDRIPLQRRVSLSILLNRFQNVNRVKEAHNAANTFVNSFNSHRSFGRSSTDLEDFNQFGGSSHFKSSNEQTNEQNSHKSHSSAQTRKKVSENIEQFQKDTSHKELNEHQLHSSTSQREEVNNERKISEYERYSNQIQETSKHHSNKVVHASEDSVTDSHFQNSDAHKSTVNNIKSGRIDLSKETQSSQTSNHNSNQRISSIKNTNQNILNSNERTAKNNYSRQQSTNAHTKESISSVTQVNEKQTNNEYSSSPLSDSDQETKKHILTKQPSSISHELSQPTNDNGFGQRMLKPSYNDNTPTTDPIHKRLNNDFVVPKGASVPVKFLKPSISSGNQFKKTNSTVVPSVSQRYLPVAHPEPSSSKRFSVKQSPSSRSYGNRKRSILPIQIEKVVPIASFYKQSLGWQPKNIR